MPTSHEIAKGTVEVAKQSRGISRIIAAIRDLIQNVPEQAWTLLLVIGIGYFVVGAIRAIKGDKPAWRFLLDWIAKLWSTLRAEHQNPRNLTERTNARMCDLLAILAAVALFVWAYEKFIREGDDTSGALLIGLAFAVGGILIAALSERLSRFVQATER